MSKSNIFLIGFMSSGKSSIGRQLAKKLNREFMDLDQMIEKESRKSIPQIFEEEGEEVFRELESKALKSIPKERGLVLALGGGTPCNEDNLAFIKSNGISIYLKIEPSILIGRLRQNAGKRPLLKDMDPQQLADFVHQKMMEREKYYDMADHILKSNNPTAAQLMGLLKLN